MPNLRYLIAIFLTLLDYILSSVGIHYRIVLILDLIFSPTNYSFGYKGPSLTHFLDVLQ